MGGENTYSDPAATTKVTLSGNVDSKDPLVTYSTDGSGYPMAVSFYDNVGNLYNAKFNLIKSSETSNNDFSVRISDILGPDGKSILSRWMRQPVLMFLPDRHFPLAVWMLQQTITK